ncbi:MAG: nitroreductase family protein [Bacteroidales bacterium]|nr:nitroreductase family protein [Bacteroidales bacterium]
MKRKDRRSIRSYSDKEVSQELLNDIISAASRASTTGNMQLYSIIVTRSQEMKEKLSPFHFNQPMIKSAPIVLTFCADLNRFVKWCEINNAIPGYDNFQSFTAAMLDTTIIAQAFCDEAESRGLGICYLGTTTYNAKDIIDTLALPKRVIPITTITVGYPADIPPQVERLPLEAFVHNEVYCDYDEKMIKSLYSEKESLEANQKFVKENNKETLAQVFTDIRYTKNNNEVFSKKFIDVLKENNFL